LHKLGILSKYGNGYTIATRFLEAPVFSLLSFTIF
jgi:hypothetical protein